MGHSLQPALLPPYIVYNGFQQTGAYMAADFSDFKVKVITLMPPVIEILVQIFAMTQSIFTPLENLARVLFG